MSGKLAKNDIAQLALMDAMVFFAISAVICGMMMSHAMSEDDVLAGEVYAHAAPDEVLAAYLEASLGRGFAFDGLGMELTGREQFGEVLFLLSALALEGCSLDTFEPLTSHYGSVLADLCSPSSPCLRLSAEGGDGWLVLFSIGQQPDIGADTASATQNIGASEGTAMVATLVLSPALLPHGIEV